MNRGGIRILRSVALAAGLWVAAGPRPAAAQSASAVDPDKVPPAETRGVSAQAARDAEAAKKLAAQTASEKPAEDKTLHKPVAKVGTGDKKSPDKKGQWKNEGANKRQGLKTRGATGGTGWRDGKHGKRPSRSDSDEAHAFQAPDHFPRHLNQQVVQALHPGNRHCSLQNTRFAGEEKGVVDPFQFESVAT